MSHPPRPVSRVRNVMTNWGAYIFSVVVNFFLSPFVVHSLGDSAYGIWILLGSLVGYLGLLDLGVRGAVTRFIARYHTKQEHLEATRVTSSALAIFTTLGLLAILAATGIAVFIGHIFNIPPELVSVARIVLILGGINVAVSIISGVFGGIVTGLQRFEYVNAVEVGIQATRALAIVLALQAGFGLVALAAIQLCMSTVRGVANYLMSRRLYPEVRTTYGECHRRHIKMIFSFSVSMVLLQAAGMLILYTDSVVIGSFLPVGMITFFAIAATLTEYARAPISGISQAVSPWVSELEAGAGEAKLQQVLLFTARIATLVVLPIVLTFMLRGKTFIALWMGPQYAEPTGNVLWILSMALTFAVGYQVVVATMMGISRHGGLVPAFMIEALCNLGLSIMWIRSYGIIGVAWGTAVPRVIASVFFAPWYARRVLGTTMRSFWLSVWLRPGVAMIPFALGSYAIERWWPASNLLIYFTQVVLALPLAAVGAWVVSFTPDERRRIVPDGALKQLLRRGLA